MAVETIHETSIVTVTKYRLCDIAALLDDPVAIERGDIPEWVIDAVKPVETVEAAGNLLMFGGASNLWEYAIGNGTATAAQTSTYLDAANAHIGVGDSATAAAATQTDLQGTSSRRPMMSTYPLHTDGTGSANADIVFKAIWGTSQANFAWQEWALFNALTGGRMTVRKVESLGTKPSTELWTLATTITLA